MFYNQGDQGAYPPGVGSARSTRHTAKIRVLLADKYVLVRECMKLLIDASGDIEVVAEASTGRAAVQRAVEFVPGVMLIEATIPLVSAVSVTHQVLRNAPNTKIMAFSATGDNYTLRDMHDAGATCYAFERCTDGSLRQAIRAHANGAIYTDDSLSFSSDSFGASGELGELSEREAAVLRRIAQGYANKEIAAQLGLSVKTVETYKARSMGKLGIVSRTDIVRYAVRQGWLG